MRYITGDTEAQSAAIEVMKKEFLSLVWNQGYEGAKERHERISKALEKCGHSIDIYWVDWLFYELEEIARARITQLTYLIQTTDPKALKDKFPDIPDGLIEIAEDVRAEETRLKQQKSRWDKELQRDGTPKFGAKRLAHAEWLRWKHHRTREYASNEDFAAKMVAKYPDIGDEEGSLVKHSTITRKWIPEWKIELGIFNDWRDWKDNKILYPSPNAFCLEMLDKHLSEKANNKKEERRKLHYKIINYLIPQWEDSEGSPYRVE